MGLIKEPEVALKEDENRVDPNRTDAKQEAPQTDRNTFVCITCGKEVRSQQGLKTHQRQVHELKKYIEKSRATCTVCHKQFDSSDALWQHQLSKHAEVDETARTP